MRHEVHGGWILLFAASLFCTAMPLHAQVVMEADGPGNTYERIQASGYGVEVPECGHESFGRHITEEWDEELGKNVFVFHIHVKDDDDRCINFDRQRNEIKTFGPSPDAMKGTYGETHTYRWKFKLDSGFKSSPNFTHIHQIKGDGGGAPIITITPRAGNPDKLQLIHTGSNGGGVIHEVDLAPFKGIWIEAHAKVLYTDNGTYELTLRRVSDGAVLMSWSSSDIDLWLEDKPFNRPKFGIYRSLKSASYLRDEQVRFADFCLAEGADTCAKY